MSVSKGTDGRYHVYVKRPDPATSSRRQYHRTAKTYAEAQRIEREIERSVEDGIPPSTARQTVAEFLMEYLDAVKPRVTPETWRSYESKLRAHIIPAIGAVRVSKVTPLLLDKVFSQMGRDRGRGWDLNPQRPFGTTGLEPATFAISSPRPLAALGAPLRSSVSDRTRHAVYRVLSQAFKRAVDFGDLPRNPCAALRLTKGQRTKPAWLGPQDAHRLLEACQREDSDYADLIALMLLTGLRKSEALGLRWQDVNMAVAARRDDAQGHRPSGRNSQNLACEGWGDAGEYLKPGQDRSTATLNISQTRQRVNAIPGERGKGLVVSERTKTAGSAASVALGPEAADILRRVKARQKVVGIALVFAACQEQTLGRALRRLLSENGLPVVTVHGLRHTHASLLFAAGVSIKAVQDRLRHSSSQTTSDIYVHMGAAVQADAAARLEALIAAAGERREEAQG